MVVLVVVVVVVMIMMMTTMMIHSFVVLLLKCTIDDSYVRNLFITTQNVNSLQPGGNCVYDQI